MICTGLILDKVRASLSVLICGLTAAHVVDIEVSFPWEQSDQSMKYITSPYNTKI
jgi:hypothetical protein